MPTLVSSFIILGFTYILFKLYQKLVAKPVGFPPGPPSIPFLGSIPFAGLVPWQTVQNWKSKYGDIVGLKIGNLNAIVLNNVNDAKEAFNQEVFSGIHKLGDKAEDFLLGGKDVIAFDGEKWKDQRKFAIKNLRDMDFRKNSNEIHEVISDLIDNLKNQCGKPMSPYHLIGRTILNYLFHVVAGKRFDLLDPKLLEIEDKGRKAMASLIQGTVTFYLNPLAELMPELCGLNNCKRAVTDFYILLQKVIDEHKETYQENNLRDYMDVYLQKVFSTTNPNSSFFKEIGVLNLRFMSLAYLCAGTDTTKLTFGWAVYFVASDIKVQKKLQNEIDTVVGTSRLPSLEDKSNMPYTEAVMLEVHRMASLAAVGVPHRVMEDVSFRNYKLPKDTLVFINLYGHHYDEKIWEDPKTFRPERFLSEDGKEIKQGYPPVLPFSIGLRTCPGDKLARSTFFLFLTSIFQRFSITVADSKVLAAAKKPYLVHNLMRNPPKIEYIFEDRLMQEQ